MIFINKNPKDFEFLFIFIFIYFYFYFYFYLFFICMCMHENDMYKLTGIDISAITSRKVGAVSTTYAIYAGMMCAY